MLRRSIERFHERKGEQESWLTFRAQDRSDPISGGLGVFQNLNEDRVPPGGSLMPSPRVETEIVVYVREGTLGFQDSTGRSRVIRAGEFQLMTAGHDLRFSHVNASWTDWAHVFQVHLSSPNIGLQPSQGQKRFSAAERRGVLCPIASPDARSGSLRLHQDSLVYSALLDRGQHIVHGLAPGRTAWLQLLHGSVQLGDLVLLAGDSAGFSDEVAVSFTAKTDAEVMLLEFAAQAPRRADESIR